MCLTVLNDNILPTIIIFEEDRFEYFDALEAWDSAQKLEPMIAFLKKQAVKTWRDQIK